MAPWGPLPENGRETRSTAGRVKTVQPISALNRLPGTAPAARTVPETLSARLVSPWRVLEPAHGAKGGLGKSSLAADVLSAYLDPLGPLHRPGAESILLASSLDQARITFRFLRAALTGEDYRWLDSGQRVGVTHVPSDTRVRVASSDAKKAFGLGSSTPAIVGDEPGAWQERGGALMFDALETSGGKSDTRLFLIGTRAPGADGGWWRSLLEAESDPSTYVQIHDAPVDDDDQVISPLSWKTIRRAQPLLGWNPVSPAQAGSGAPQGEEERHGPAPVHHIPAQPTRPGAAVRTCSLSRRGSRSRRVRFRRRSASPS